MKHQLRPSRQPVEIVESSVFTMKVGQFLSEVEQRGFQLLIADDPTRGEAVSGYPGLLRISFASCIVYYSINLNKLKIYCLDIESINDDSPPPSKEEASILRKTLSILAKAAIITLVKRGLKWLLDFFGDGPPP